MLSGLSNTKADATYNFEKNSFKRTVKYIFIESEAGEPNMDKMMTMMGENGTYQTSVNTERKIKKVKGEHAKSQEDDRVVFEYPFMESLQGSVNTDFEIILSNLDYLTFRVRRFSALFLSRMFLSFHKSFQYEN